MIKRSELRKAYDKAIAFFRENPKRWTKGKLWTSDGCMCLAGRISFELGHDPEKELNEFRKSASEADTIIRLCTGYSVIGVNDMSVNIHNMINRAETKIGARL